MCKRDNRAIRIFVEEINMHEERSMYEEGMFGTVGGAMISAKEMRTVLKYLKLKPSHVVLDVGTGSGRFARAIVKNDADVIGVDVDITMLKSAILRRRELGECERKYQLILADGQYLPFRESSFDAIVSIRCLKYFSNYYMGIREMARVLKPDAILVLELSNIFSWDFFLRSIRAPLGYETLFKYRQMKNVLLQNNLKVKDWIGLHKIHPKIWFWCKSNYILRFLEALELVLQRLTPRELFSRGIVVKCVKK